MPCKNHPAVEQNLVQCQGCRQSFCPDCVVELQGKMYCADCKAEAVKDIKSGVGGELQLASIGVRFVAIFIDGLVLLIPVVAVVLVLTFLLVGAFVATGSQALGFGMEILVGLLASIPAIVYEALMLSARGQTLGKMAMKIKVVTPEGQPITAGQAWTRALTRQLLALLRIIGVLINYLPAFGKERACVHDRIAKTRVVRC